LRHQGGGASQPLLRVEEVSCAWSSVDLLVHSVTLGPIGPRVTTNRAREA
jgi:hypothetical protein